MIATAESLTAGALVARLVDAPGASGCIAGGAACYSYAAKTRVLGVDPGVLERDGAVTAEVAAAMARGALDVYGADVALATTGVAGPGPDERGVAAGTVHVAIAMTGATARRLRPEEAAQSEGTTVLTRSLRLVGDRSEVRMGTVRAALALLDEALPGS